MANIPLQSITFPGLADKYTTPTVDSTLTQTGAAADAKKTGDEIGAIKNDLTQISDELYDYTYQDPDDWEIGGVSYGQTNGWSYTGNNREIRPVNSSGISLTQGTVISLGDFTATLTKLNGTTEALPLTLWVWWRDSDGIYHPDSSTSQTTDFTCPTDGTYMFAVSTTNYITTAFYTDAVAKMSGKIVIIGTDGVVHRVGIIEQVVPQIRRAIKNPLCKFIAHQGYTPNAGTNHDVLEGYARAGEHGFDWAETDVRTTSDGYLVCVHDPTFTDATTGGTVTIATSTLAELEAHDFYGSTIATLDAVLQSCKNSGIGLVIDQIGTEEINAVYDAVKKYDMLDNVGWCVAVNSPNTSIILSKYAKAKIFVLASSETFAEVVTYGNSIATADNEIILYMSYTVATVENILANYADLEDNVHIGIWVVNYMPYLTPRLPYVSFIASDKITYYDLISS